MSCPRGAVAAGEALLEPMTHLGVEAPTRLGGRFDELLSQLLRNAEQIPVGPLGQEGGLCQRIAACQPLISAQIRLDHAIQVFFAKERGGREPARAAVPGAAAARDITSTARSPARHHGLVVRRALPRLALAGAVLAAAVAAPAGGAALRARLTLVDLAPVTVVGRGFEPRERVVVRVRWDGDHTAAKAVVAGVRGRFVVRFRSLAFGGCDVFTVTARGGRGSRATLRLLPPPCGTTLDP